ncbi:cupin-like domain-containing protein [Microbulbifer sp. TYP-18]|uniref:cupin-like domain-containing protein n=1 Tax=Microbulbifer sp. TYP-18 TaxID=3230024 RepID=UPI0034C6D7C2
MGNKTDVESVLQVLDYTKSNKKWFDEKELFAGYHTVSIQGQTVKGQRDPKKRLAKVDYDFNGKRVLDVGCSNGGLLHALAEQVAFAVGVDFNAKCINAANALKAINQRDNTHFYTFDLDKEDLSMLRHFVFGEPVDICFFFNISIWVKRWKEAFRLCSEMTTTLLFEAHGNEKQQAEQLRFVKSIYQDVQLLSEQSDDDPTYAKRKMYRCETPLTRQVVTSVSGEENFLKVYSEQTVKDAYQAVFPDQPIESIEFYPNTHESVVADINGDYIVKFPRPHRGLDGVNTEQSVTDFMRDKLSLPIPALSVYTKPVVMARYQKLAGNTFNKNRYAALSELDKTSIAKQLAELIATFHAVDTADAQRHNITLSPSWDLSVPQIEEQLGQVDDPVIKQLLPEVVKNQKALQVPESNQVLGHFDLHGGNLLVNSSHKQLTAVIDFGNCKVGDLHQDLSVMNLSSPDLAERIATCYEAIAKRKLNRLLIQHYTTIFYINLLAGLKRKKADKQYAYWSGELNRWYDYLLQDRARARLNKRPPATSMPAGWRKWLASNIMKGASVEGLKKVLNQQGFSPLDIATEIQLITEHPYVEAGTEIFQTLNKRNWLLKTCDKLAALDTRYYTAIEKRTTPDFQCFINEYYSKHLPAVFTDGVNHWPALKKWTPEYLLEHYGDQSIEVQFGRDTDPLFERNSSKHKKRMLMREFVDLIRREGETNNFYMTANNTKNSFTSLEPLFEDVADFGERYRQKESIQSANLFWFGPKGTFTPIHHDLTNNMLVQLYGRKKVTLIPAFQVPWMYNDKGVFSAADYPNYDAERHPSLEKVTPVEVILQPGESLFIPIGWWHCVEALDVTIGISFTNFNAPNNFAAEFPKP